MVKPEIGLIIFDFDGVIVNSGTDIANAVNYTLKYFDRPTRPVEEIIGYVGNGAENLIRQSFEEYTEELIKRAMPVYMEYYLSHCIVDTVLYENVKETLEFFRYKKIGLVTNKPEELTLRILEGLKVREYFHKVVGPESVNKLKPHPEGLLKVADELREDPKKAIMVGDSYTDIQAGRAAGMYTCGVTYGLGSPEKLINEKPDFLIDDMLMLTELIK